MTSKDNLTGIFDRSAFFKLLQKLVDETNIHRTKLALVIVDINRFYKINNSFGYETGDLVLTKFSNLLRNVAREQDFVARIGDNRFALILTGIMNLGHAELAAHKILRLLETPFMINEKPVRIDATIAISLCPLHASNYIYLMKECESVLHETKQNNLKIGVSKSPDEEEISESWDIELALDTALDNDELHVFYQPKISLDSGGVVGAEALLRWDHPVQGFIAPDYFVPIAERMGHIQPITNWVINTVLRQCAEWPDKWGVLSVSVNVPSDYLLQPDFKDQIVNALKLWSNDNIVLTLEIIERSLVQDTEKSFLLLEELRDMGIHISIDDFGTGYSSLSYFENLPVDELKIDQSFITHLVKNQNSQKLVKLIVDLAHAFDMEVVAEGVEDAISLGYLKNFNCDIVQGFLFAKAMPHEEIKDWLKNFSGIDAYLQE